MHSVLLAVIVALTPASAGSAQGWHPTSEWLAAAQCIHLHEGPWSANTGNGYFGGMQFAPKTWVRLSGRSVSAFAHPGDPAYPFTVSPREQLLRAFLLWVQDGRSWRSWGAVGASCARGSP